MIDLIHKKIIIYRCK